MVLLRRTLNQGLPAEIAEIIVKSLPRRGKETSGTIHSNFKKLDHLIKPRQQPKPNKVSKIHLKPNGAPSGGRIPPLIREWKGAGS